MSPIAESLAPQALVLTAFCVPNWMGETGQRTALFADWAGIALISVALINEGLSGGIVCEEMENRANLNLERCNGHWRNSAGRSVCDGS